jgi:hypothetical protein
MIKLQLINADIIYTIPLLTSQLQTIPAMFGLIWFSSFRGKDLNVKVYGRMDDDGRQVMAKAHMAFGQVS